MLMLTRSSETHNRTIDASKTLIQDGPLLSIYLHNSTCKAGQVSVESVAIQRDNKYTFHITEAAVGLPLPLTCAKNAKHNLPEGCTTKEAQQTLAFFERAGSTKFNVSVGDNEHHDGGYEVALSSQVLLIRFVCTPIKRGIAADLPLLPAKTDCRRATSAKRTKY